MSLSLPININTVITCSGCQDVAEYFRNGSDQELADLTTAGFVYDAILHFISEWWVFDGKHWHCRSCRKAATGPQASCLPSPHEVPGSPNLTTTQRRAA